ncbi:MAG: phosphomannomutase [Gallionella sp.]|nr:phosphomannomutase [Gallionella sp.]
MASVIQMAPLSVASKVGFGTSGARGLVSDMTDQVCWAYVTAFLQAVVPGAKRVVLGQDLRPSSRHIVEVCAAAVRDRGMQPVYAGVLPTPALALYAMQAGIPAVMVTGSHIPFDRNGIKFYTAQGEISKADEQAILAAELADPGVYSGLSLALDPLPVAHYQQRYRDFFPANFLACKRIGVYEHSSVARDFLRPLLEGFGATVISLGRSDDFVPVDTEAVSEADQALARDWTQTHKLDALLSTDGDADRPLIGDETGRWLRGDIVGLLCSRYLRARTVVLPVSCNTAIDRCGDFGQVIRTRIGSPYVIAGMEAAGAAGATDIVGFEANGGFLVGSTMTRDGHTLAMLPTRDAVLPMLALLALAHAQGVPLSGILSGLPPRFTASDRIQEFPTARSRALLAEFQASPQSVGEFFSSLCGEAVDRDLTDGLRLTFANGEIVHLRPSGNAPELRCYAEADSESRAKALVVLTLEKLKQLHH